MRPPVLPTNHEDLAHEIARASVAVDVGDRFWYGPDRWWIDDQRAVRVGAEVLVPDVAGWRAARTAQPPDSGVIELVPDWICEVLAPATADLDREKRAIYARAGVAWLWLVDPIARTLETLRLDDGRWIAVASHRGAAKVRAAPFDAAELDLGPWWWLDEVE